MNCLYSILFISSSSASLLSTEAPPNPWVRFASPISIVVAIVIIAAVAGLLVTVITKKYRETIDNEIHLVSVQDNRVQDGDFRAATVTHYQPLMAVPKLQDIPQAAAKATASSCTGLNDGIYEEPDLGESSVPTSDMVHAHEYLALDQDVPSMSRSFDEYHKYNYPEMIRSKPKIPVRACRVDNDGYLLAESDIQGLPNPGSKVYYSSRLPESQVKGEIEISPTPKSNIHYSSRIPSPVHQGPTGNKAVSAFN